MKNKQMSKKKPAAKTNADQLLTEPKYPKQTRRAVYQKEACRHSVFTFTPKRTRQICALCGAKRSICIKEDHTATVGEWKSAG